VIAEGHGWFLRRYDRRRAVQFLPFIDALPAIEIQSFDGAGLAAAAKIAKKFSDQDLTLADAHGLAVMRAAHRCCCSTDRHLSPDGVPLAM
jgi:predicted nucleic acid-binding protein